MEGLEAHLGEGVPLGRHNSAISRCRFRRAGATGGGREGRPRQSRILRATAGSSIAARTYPAAAAWTFQHIHDENSRHQLGPAVIARMRLFFFGAVSMSAGFRVRRSSRLKPIVWGKSTFSRRIQVPVLSSEWPQDAIQTCPYQVASSYRTATPARKSGVRRYINNDCAGTFTLLPLVRI